MRLRLVISNREHGRIEKILLNYTSKDYFKIDDDLYDDFIDQLQWKYTQTMDFFGVGDDGTDDHVGYELVDANVPYDVYIKIFDEFTEFIEQNI